MPTDTSAKDAIVPAGLDKEGNLVNEIALTFEHVATGTKVQFSSGLKNFSDNFSSNWNSETVYGRMDPIMTFQNTQRDMSIEFLVNQDTDTAKYYLPGDHGDDVKTGVNEVEAVQFLATLLYPTYGDDNSLSIKDPPLLRIHFPDLIGKDRDNGLLVAVQSITYDRGTLYTPVTAPDANREILTPKFINTTITFTPLHEFDLGWQKVARKDLDPNDVHQFTGTLYVGSMDNLTVVEKPQVWRFGGKAGEDKIFQNGVIIKDYTKKKK